MKGVIILGLAYYPNVHFELSEKEIETLKASLLDFVSCVSKSPCDYPKEALLIMPEIAGLLIS